MSSWSNIFAGGILLVAGAVLSYLLLWWKGYSLKKVKSLEAQAMLEKARTEAEVITRDARLAANQEALNAKEALERSSSARRAERAELERRLGDRESLINSQLERVVETEKSLKEQTEVVRKRGEALENLQLELEKLTRQTLDQLQNLAGLTQ